MTNAGNGNAGGNGGGLDPEMVAIVEDFLVECRENIAEVEPLIVGLEAGGESSEQEETIAVIFRLFHSTKGSAGFIGLANLERVTHAAESILDVLRGRPALLSSQHIDALCAALDFTTRLVDKVEAEQTDTALERESDAMVAHLRACLDALQVEKEEDDKYATSSVEITVSPETVEKFAAEASDQLDLLETLLLRFETEPEDDELVAEAFRQIHSFKGNSGFLGLGELEAVSHAIEDVLGLLKTADRSLCRQSVSELLKCVDELRRTVRSLNESKGKVADRPALLRTLRNISRELRSEGELPPPEQLVHVVASLLRSGRLSREEIPSLIAADQGAMEFAGVGTRTPDEPAPPAESPKSETPAPPEPAAPVAAPKRDAAASQPAPSSGDGTKEPSGVSKPATQYIRVEVDKLDILLNQVGELINAAAGITHHPGVADLGLESFDQATNNLNRIIGGLHDTSMALRMVPLSAIFRKMLRVARDVSRKLGKRVELELRGEHTEVDKTVMESIADPLIHIIRNAVDHGVETPAERTGAGKNPMGRVRLEAKHQGGEVWIVVSDDGSGINASRLLDKARSRGIVGPHQELSDQQIYRLIFEPGFSTASAVTDISGRGVGMDVVRRNIEALRGSVDVTSAMGAGTTFTIRLPLTLAIIDAMVVRVGPSICGIPLTSVHESFRPDASQFLAGPTGSQMVRIRERLYPVLKLESLYGSHWRGACSDDTGVLVLVEDQDAVYCLRADELLGQRQLVIKPLDAYLNMVRGVSGCSFLGSGEICLILDVANLGRVASVQSPAMTSETPTEATAATAA
ncbi:MAG: chemotaxis protein CheA [Myxococcales bacterium FL481]|nr:MAG: chemotaxis protein CheA [Myxococcales bacterium FL481]